MVLVMVLCLEEDPGIVFGDVKQFPFQICPESVIDHLSSVLGGENDMIFTMVETVTSFAIFHGDIVPHGCGSACIPELTLGGLCAR